MFYGLVHVSGRMNDEERSQRVGGLAHNLAYSEKYAQEVVDFQRDLTKKGRWQGAPPLDPGILKAAYAPGLEAEAVERSQLSTKPISVSKPEALRMSRAQRKTNLDDLIQRKVIERESKSWLLEALDPFHDTRIDLKGMPDTNLASSVIQCIPYTQSIKQPASIGNTNNWDCHIVAWPIPVQQPAASSQVAVAQGPTTLNNYAPSAYRLGASGPNLFPVGGVTSYSVISGNQTFGDSAGTSSTTDITLGLEETYVQGNARVIGMGMECSNTTAPLYRQGQVFCYRQPTPPPSDKSSVLLLTTSATLRGEDGCEACRKAMAPVCNHMGKSHEAEDVSQTRKGEPAFSDLEGRERAMRRMSLEKEKAALAALFITAWGWVDTWMTQSPPQTLAQAQKLSGTTTWEAERGAYIVAAMNTTLNPAAQEKPICFGVDQGDLGNTDSNPAVQIGGAFVPSSTDWQGPAKAGAAGTLSPIAARGLHIAPFNTCGAYFTGLSPQTTLQITVKYYVERFPTPFENDLIVLAKPSSPFDPRALEIYGLAMNELPIAVPVGENPLGEWFSSVLDKVAKVASPIAKGLSMVPGIGAPAAIVGNVADAYMNARRPQKEKQKAKRKKKTAAQGGNAGQVANPANNQRK